MFTGIIQDVGRIARIESDSAQTHMTFVTGLELSRWQPGDSVAVDGCCLTVTRMPEPDSFSATLSRETLERTCFSSAAPGQPVNLEPALRLGEALGGHWVTGHVDGIGRVVAREPDGEHVRLTIELPQAMSRYVVVKGSIAVGGVSLTVNEVVGCRFSVNLIPHTLRHTNLETLQLGDHVNIETDILGRYVERLLASRSGKAGEPWD